MKVVIHSNEPLVFRDGRPFGDSGHVHGGVLDWPRPSTVTGLLRHCVGRSRRPDFFQGERRNEDIAAIKKVTASLILPLWQKLHPESQWEPLFPAPADALLLPDQKNPDKLRITGFSYTPVTPETGCDLPWRNWLLPISEEREKPAANTPGFWRREPFFTWLETGRLPGSWTPGRLGCPLPTPELRLHTAIDPCSGAADHGRLFATQGISLLTPEAPDRPAGRLGIGVALAGLEPDDDPTGPCFFGGERKSAHIDATGDFLPPCPDWFAAGCRYLRLVLVAPGDFGDWAPAWLEPAGNESETGWRVIPGSTIEVRLVSACVPRWQPVSGWDYARGGPKATRKLVPAGAVYVIELKDPARAAAAAARLWGRSLNNDLSDSDGCVVVGKLDIQQGGTI